MGAVYPRRELDFKRKPAEMMFTRLTSQGGSFALVKFAWGMLLLGEGRVITYHRDQDKIGRLPQAPVVPVSRNLGFDGDTIVSQNIDTGNLQEKSPIPGAIIWRKRTKCLQLFHSTERRIRASSSRTLVANVIVLH